MPTLEVVLRADVRHLGRAGEIVTVAPGYARNYLLPRNLAKLVNQSTKQEAAALRLRREEREKTLIEQLRTLAAKLAETTIAVTERVSNTGSLYGSVSAKTIVDNLAAKGLTIDTHAVVLNEPIKELGEHQIKIHLHPEVETAITLVVHPFEETES